MDQLVRDPAVFAEGDQFAALGGQGFAGDPALGDGRGVLRTPAKHVGQRVFQ